MCNCENKKECTCKRANNVIYTESCAEKIDTNCVIYKPKGGDSELPTLNIPSKKPLSFILEKIDLFLKSLINFVLSEDDAEALDLPETTTLKEVVEKIIEKINGVKDEKVKASISDPIPGYLLEKIECNNCITKTLKTNSSNVQVVELSIDVECFKLLLE